MSYEEQIYNLESWAGREAEYEGECLAIAREADARIADLEAENKRLREALEALDELSDAAMSEHDDGAAVVLMAHKITNTLAKLENPNEPK
jgi:hypothetical protein